MFGVVALADANHVPATHAESFPVDSPRCTLMIGPRPLNTCRDKSATRIRCDSALGCLLLRRRDLMSAFWSDLRLAIRVLIKRSI